MRNPEQIRTYYGVDMDPFHPAADEISIRDIAHALSLLCRANGHIEHFFSVAQHCLNCELEAKARGLDARTRLFCLLHDATECYMADITRPVKRRFPLYYEAESNLADVIYRALCGFLPTDGELLEVGKIDDSMLYYEFLNLCGIRMFDTAPELSGVLSFEKTPAAEVERQYIERFYSLLELAGGRKNG